MARCTFCEREVNPLRTLGGSDSSRCGAVRFLSMRSEPSAHIGWVESLSLSRGAHFERAKKTLCALRMGRIALAVARCAFGDRSFVQKRRSQVSIKSVVQKCRLEVSLTSVDQQRRSSEVSTEVLVRSVNCCSKVLMTSKVSVRSVDQKCCSEVSCRSVDEQCGSEVLVRSVAQNCR